MHGTCHAKIFGDDRASWKFQMRVGRCKKGTDCRNIGDYTDWSDWKGGST